MSLTFQTSAIQDPEKYVKMEYVSQWPQGWRWTGEKINFKTHHAFIMDGTQIFVYHNSAIYSIAFSNADDIARQVILDTFQFLR
jgi:hypothetical protein